MGWGSLREAHVPAFRIRMFTVKFQFLLPVGYAASLSEPHSPLLVPSRVRSTIFFLEIFEKL